MKKSEIIFMGIIITIVIMGLVIFWYWRTIPTDSEITSATVVVKPANKNILSDSSSQLLDSLQISIQTLIPAQTNYNNEDPFF